MTTSPFDHSTDRHPSDGVLLALHDGERDETGGAELDAGRRHVERCGDCRARLAVIAARSSRVRESLSFIPVPADTTGALRRRVAAASGRRAVPLWRRPAWHAAGGMIVIAGVAAAAATGPVRAWMRHRLESPMERGAPVQPPAAAAPQSVDRSGATVSFAATGPGFTVRFDSLPVAGLLTVDGTTADEISARVVSGAGTGGDAMLILPGELRVRNSTAARASYAISVPRVVTRLRVIVAGRVVFDGTPRTVVRLNPAR